MRSLIFLEKALLDEDNAGVSDYLSEIDRKTSNAAYRLLGDNFGLKTMEISGVVYSHLVAASLLMGYSDPSSLSQLVRSYQITCPKIGWYEFETRTRIRKMFNLEEKNSKATLVPYEGILVIGMYGRTKEADKIKSYLISAERAMRIGIATVDDLKLANQRLKTAKDIVSMASMIDKMSNGYFKDSATNAFEKLTGNVFPKSPQMEFDFDKTS